MFCLLAYYWGHLHDYMKCGDASRLSDMWMVAWSQSGSNEEGYIRQRPPGVLTRESLAH